MARSHPTLTGDDLVALSRASGLAVDFAVAFTGHYFLGTSPLGRILRTDNYYDVGSFLGVH